MTEPQPLVSIVIPCYNHENYVQKTIQSVIEQDYDNIELIIIDDGSKDDSVTKIEEMIPVCKQRFKRFEFRHRPNKGLCGTLNEALEWCEGEFFSPSASDDILSHNKISIQVNKLNENKFNNIVGVFVGINIIDSNNKIIGKKGRNSKFGFKNILLRKAFMPGQAVMLITNEVKKIGGYNSDYKVEDLYVFLKLAHVGFYFISIKDHLVFYRRHDDNLSSKSEVMWQAISKIIYDYKDHEKYIQALSCSMLIHAHTIQVNSKKDSLLWLRKSLTTYPLNIFSISFLRLSLKYFIK